MAKLKALEPKITEAFHIAQELQNEQTDVEGNLQISQALDLKERCKTLREKNLSLRLVKRSNRVSYCSNRNNNEYFPAMNWIKTKKSMLSMLKS